MAGKQPQGRRVVGRVRGGVEQREGKRADARPSTSRTRKPEPMDRQLTEERALDAQRLLLAITRAQSLFINDEKPEAVFGAMLQELLTLTGSNYGFIGEVDRTPEGQPFLRTHAITDIAWNAATKALMVEQAPTLVFRNLKTLFGHVMTTGKPVIANDPAHDPRAGGLPPGHPPMHAFLGLPFYRGELLTGMVGMANRPGGYDEALVTYLVPFLSTCAQLLEGYRHRQLQGKVERALRESEERWQLAVRGSHDGIWDWNIATGTVFFSARWKAMRGFEEQEITDSLAEWRDGIHPDDLERVLHKVDLHLTKQAPEFCEEYRVRRKDGSYIWVLDRGVALWDDDGVAVRMAGSESDITERKREEAFLLAEKQALELVTQGGGLSEVLTFICRTIETHSTSMLSSVMLVTEDGAHLSLAAGPSLPDEYKRVCEGLPLGPMAGSCGRAVYLRKPSIVTDIATDPLWKDYAPAALAHGLKACWSLPILISGGKVLGTFCAYYRVPRAPQPTELTIVERASRIAALAIQHTKVTEALRASEARFQAFMAHSPAVTFIKDKVGRHLYINPKYEELFGVSRDEVKGKTVFDFMPAEIATKLHQNDQLVFSSGQALEIEETVPVPDGTARHWLVIKFPLDVGQSRLLGGVAIDITARKRAEDEQRRTHRLLTNVINATPDLIFVKDRHLRTVLCNDVFAQASGKGAADLFGHTDIENGWDPELVHGNPDKGIRGYEQDDRDALNGQVVHNTNDPANVNGAMRIFDTIKVPLRDEQGAITGVLGIARDVTERRRMEETLNALVRGTGGVTGEAFFPVFTRELARALGVTCAAVSDLNPERPGWGMTRAMWCGQDWMTQFEYKLAGTPCEVVVRDGSAYYPSEVQAQFPDDADLVPLQAQSYAGLLLHDSAGERLGHLFIIDDKPLANADQTLAILRIFASRAAAELERLRIDGALRASRERFELAARATNDGIWDWNIVTGHLYRSDRNFALLGREPGDLTPSYEVWMSVVHPEDADRARQAVDRHLKTREPYDIELRVRMKDSRYRWFRDQGQAVWDVEGRPVRMVGSIADVTDQRLAEDALRAAHAELEQRVIERTAQLEFTNHSLQDEIAERRHIEKSLRLTQFSVDRAAKGILWASPTADILYVNDAACQILGHSRDQLLRMRVHEIDPNFVPETWSVHWEELKRRGSFTFESSQQTKASGLCHTEVTVNYLAYEGEEYHCAIVLDVTERKEIEARLAHYTEELEREVAERTAEIAKLESQRAQTERLAALGRLAAGVAHEINNPIAGIKNAFTLVKQAVDPAHSQYEFIGLIDREIARVSSIVQHMYQLYSRESAKVESVDLRTMIGDIEALFARQLQQRQLRLVVEVAPGLDRLDVPRGDLLQVLLNLLNNAIDGSREGMTITLTIREEAEVVRIALADQGAGISPEVLPYIFDPFFTTKTESEQKGMGLGLSISQSLVAAMGGTIDVHTELGQGSTFSILLPREKVATHILNPIHTIEGGYDS